MLHVKRVASDWSTTVIFTMILTMVSTSPAWAMSMQISMNQLLLPFMCTLIEKEVRKVHLHVLKQVL